MSLATPLLLLLLRFGRGLVLLLALDGRRVRLVGRGRGVGVLGLFNAVDVWVGMVRVWKDGKKDTQ